MKMDQRMIIVCSAIGSLGLLSAILGFSAEGTKLTLSDIDEVGRACHHPQNPAAGLGACAAILLVIAQITFAAVGGCCKSRAIPSGTNRTIGVVCAVSSWILAIIAFGLLVGGSAANMPGDHGGYCKEPMDGLFAGGAVLTFVATALGITSYVMLRTQPAAAAPKEGEKMPAGAAGIAMEQPQFSQQASPQGQGYGQAPPSYPQYSPPPQGQQGYGQAPNPQFPAAAAAAASPPYGQASNPHYPPPPAQGYAPNHHHHQQFPHPPAQGYGAQAPNLQYAPPPAQGYGAHAPNQQYPPPAHGYGAHAPEQQFPLASPPPAQFYGGPHTPNQQAPPPPKGDEQV